MNLFLLIIVWLLVAVFFPVVAIVVLILFPIVWLLAIPLQFAGLLVDATFELLRALLLLPARLLGSRPQ
jgi:hypothetical protein